MARQRFVLTTMTLGAVALAGVSLMRPDIVVLGDVTLPVAVVADGQRLPEGTYRLQRADALTPAGDDEPGCYWVEFVADDAVRGRELATVVRPEQADRLNRGVERPAPNSVRMDVVRANAFVRLWINRGQYDYLLNLPMAPTTR